MNNDEKYTCEDLQIFGIKIAKLALPDETDADRLTRLGLAEKAFREATVVCPEKDVAWYNLAFCLQGQRRDDEAREIYRKVLEINPKHEEALIILSTYLLSEDDPNRAISELRKALVELPRSPEIWNCLGSAYWVKHNLKAASDAFRESYYLDPSSKFVARNLYLTLRMAGQTHEARRFLKSTGISERSIDSGIRPKAWDYITVNSIPAVSKTSSERGAEYPR